MIYIENKDSRFQNFINSINFFIILSIVINSVLIVYEQNALLVSPYLSDGEGSDFLATVLTIHNIILVPFLFFINAFAVFERVTKEKFQAFLISRAKQLLIPFAFCAGLVAPLAYYAVHLNMSSEEMLHFPSYYLQYFRSWTVGPYWILLALFLVDVIVAALYRISTQTFKNIINTISKLGERKFFWLFILVLIITSTISFTLTSTRDFSILIPSPSSNNWISFGPIWIPVNILSSLLMFYAFGFLIGGVKEAKGYIISSTSTLWKGWLHRILETIIVFFIFNFIASHDAILGSILFRNILAGFTFGILLALGCTALVSFFHRFVNPENRLIHNASKVAFGIYLLHFIPVLWCQYYLVQVENLNSTQKAYIVMILSCISCVLLVMLFRKLYRIPNRLWPKLKL